VATSIISCPGRGTRLIWVITSCSRTRRATRRRARCWPRKSILDGGLNATATREPQSRYGLMSRPRRLVACCGGHEVRSFRFLTGGDRRSGEPTQFRKIAQPPDSDCAVSTGATCGSTSLSSCQVRFRAVSLNCTGRMTRQWVNQSIIQGGRAVAISENPCWRRCGPHPSSRPDNRDGSAVLREFQIGGRSSFWRYGEFSTI
jgi:hypothetical protein